MAETYRLAVDECERLIGHCWDTGTGVLGLSAMAREENYEETSKQCTCCGLREVRKVVTTYRLVAPEGRA